MCQIRDVKGEAVVRPGAGGLHEMGYAYGGRGKQNAGAQKGVDA